MRMRHKSEAPLSFLHPAGRGFQARASIRGTIWRRWRSSSASSSRRAEALNRTAKLSTEASALYERSLDSLQRDALLLAARVGDDGILYVFPQAGVLLEVDLNRDPLAVVVGDVLDSFH